MKRYLIWFSLMMKRMLKKPAFVLLLLMMPLFAVVFTKLEQGESAGNIVGIMIEMESEEAWNRKLLSVLAMPEPQDDSIIRFRVYENREDLLRDVENGELECGIMLPGDLKERLNTGTWQDAVTIYRTASAGMTEIVKEKVASIVFTLYSEESYVNYIENTEAFSMAEGNESGPAIEEIISFAQEAYEEHLADGSTFAFVYHGDDSIGRSEKEELTTPTFRLRGILAVCIFLSGLCGLLTDWQDRREERFVRIAPSQITTAVNVWIPTIYTSVIALLCLSLTGQLSAVDSGQWQIWLTGVGKEAVFLLFYQFLIVCYCSIIRLILRKQEMIAAAIPMLTFASIICCPVWIRLAVYVPFFHILEKLFPATYYLLL